MYGSASGLGMLFGLFTEGSVMCRQLADAWYAFTSANASVWLRPWVNSATLRLRLGPKAERFPRPLNPLQTN